MIRLALVNLVVFLVFSIIVDAISPPITIAQQFEADVLITMDSSTAKGHVFFDWPNVGGKLNIQWGQSEPMTYVVNTQNGLTALWNWRDNIKRCVYTGPYDPNSIHQWVPWEIPSNATYVGESQLNGYKANGWNFPYEFPATLNVTAWIASGNQNAIMKLDLVDINQYWFNRMTLQFSSVTVGPVDPSSYSVPSFCKSFTNIIGAVIS